MASPTNTPKAADRPARGPKGSIGTDWFDSETAPASAWNSTVSQASAGPGQGYGTAERGSANSPYPDAHSTVPTPEAGSGEYPWPAEKPWPAAKGGGMPFNSGSETLERVPACGDGDYPVPEERSTVEPQSAGAGARGPRQEWPRDTYSEEDAGINDGGGDGGDYRWGIPYSQKMPQASEWGMYGPENGGYGHSADVKNVDYHAARKNDWGAVDGPPHDADWNNRATEKMGYEVLGQERDEAPPTIPNGVDYPEFQSDGRGLPYRTAYEDTYGEQYPQPENITWDAEPQNLVLKK